MAGAVHMSTLEKARVIVLRNWVQDKGTTFRVDYGQDAFV